MFVSYIVEDHGYGYMCFSAGTSIFAIYTFLKSRILAKINMIFARNYSDEPIKFIETYRNGEYRLEKHDGLIQNVEDVGNIYTYLYDKYGFTNIIGFY